MSLPYLRDEIVRIDDKIRISFFPTKEKYNSVKETSQECDHLGYIVKDGYNKALSGIIQRFACTRCKKRFGSKVNEWKLYEYQFKMKQLLYELFFEGCKQLKMEKRWGIPQSKISQFKHHFVDTVFEQNPEIVISEPHELPKGVIYGDKTYMGKQGNSNTEIVFCNDKFEILAAGPVEENQQQISIINTFNKIPEKCRKKIRIMVSDGEPSYRTLTMLNNHRIILVQQYHGKKKLGQITLHKYQKFGPHILHYLIHTHWKIFKKAKHELKFKWEIKLIKGKLPIGSGRPTSQLKKSKIYQEWRQKKDDYYSTTFQKRGSAKVFINPDSKKISLRQDSKRWMQRMFQKILPLYHNKFITNNRVESKHSQIKRTGRIRKQPSLVYSDQLFILQEYILQHEHILYTFLDTRPLYHYLMESPDNRIDGYVYLNNRKNLTQKWINAYF